MKTLAFIFTLFLFSIPGWVIAQGMLPPSSVADSTTTVVRDGPMVIGEKLPANLAVTEDSGKKRSVLSYKTAIEIMVIVFFNSTCPEDKISWASLRRLDENYRDWRVQFLAIDITPGATTASALTDILKKKSIAWPVTHIEDADALRRLNISGIPQAIVIDEFGYLRYRGPLKAVPKALDIAIAHINVIREPEPSMEGTCPL